MSKRNPRLGDSSRLFASLTDPKLKITAEQEKINAGQKKTIVELAEKRAQENKNDLI